MKQKGFTAAEVIIALSISSIAILICLSAFKSISSIWKNTEESAETFSKLSCSSKKIETALSQCISGSIQIIKSKEIPESFEIYALIPSGIKSQSPYYSQSQYESSEKQKPAGITSFYARKKDGITCLYEAIKYFSTDDLQSEASMEMAIKTFRDEKEKSADCRHIIAKDISSLSFQQSSDDSDTVFFTISYAQSAFMTGSAEIMNGKKQ